MTHRFVFLAVLGLLSVAGCTSTPTPDYAIRVAPAVNGGYVAIPPECPQWWATDANFMDSQPMPHFGCANTRNFALMVDRPEDLLQGRNLDSANGVVAAGSIVRYYNSQTRGLIYPSSAQDSSVDTTTASTAASSMSGETPANSSAGK